MNHNQPPRLNILAPISVSMVVITLGAAFGVLSGRGALVGMVSTCAITLISALVGGSRYGISSPTGPMTAAIGSILIIDRLWLQTHHAGLDAIALMNVTLVVAALILFILTLCKVHRLVKWVPNLVLSGFVNGIALLIVIAQFRSMQKPPDWLLMVGTFVFALLAGKLSAKLTHPAWRLIGGAAFVIVLMSTAAWFFQLPVSYLDLSSSELAVSFALPPFHAISLKTLGIIIPLAFELALIAILDTLLTAMIMDKKSKTRSNITRELSGQSISMMGLSLIGGIPGAQSTVPSMMMWREGGHHRLSKLILALCCIGFTFLFSEAIQFVPTAVFGGIILKIAFDVADLTSFESLLRSWPRHKFARFGVAIGTAISTVFLSLNLAVICFTCIFVFWNRLAKEPMKIPDLNT